MFLPLSLSHTHTHTHTHTNTLLKQGFFAHIFTKKKKKCECQKHSATPITCKAGTCLQYINYLVLTSRRVLWQAILGEGEHPHTHAHIITELKITSRKIKRKKKQNKTKKNRLQRQRWKHQGEEKTENVLFSGAAVLHGDEASKKKGDSLLHLRGPWKRPKTLCSRLNRNHWRSINRTAECIIREVLVSGSAPDGGRSCRSQSRRYSPADRLKQPDLVSWWVGCRGDLSFSFSLFWYLSVQSMSAHYMGVYLLCNAQVT